MARPTTTAPRRPLRTFVLLAAIAALMGLLATGCGSEDEADGPTKAQCEELAATGGAASDTEGEADGEGEGEGEGEEQPTEAECEDVLGSEDDSTSDGEDAGAEDGDDATTEEDDAGEDEDA